MPITPLPDVSLDELNERWNSFYRHYPYLSHRLAWMADTLIGTKGGSHTSLTLDADTWREFRAVVADAQHLFERCFAPQQQRKFRHGNRRLATATGVEQETGNATAPMERDETR